MNAPSSKDTTSVRALSFLSTPQLDNKNVSNTVGHGGHAVELVRNKNGRITESKVFNFAKPDIVSLGGLKGPAFKVLSRSGNNNNNNKKGV